MALKAFMLRHKIDQKRAELEALRAKDADFEKREAELEQAIEEAETDEQKQAVEQGVGSFESEKSAHDDAKAKLEREIGELEADLEKEEASQNRGGQQGKDPERNPANKHEREVEKTMFTREKFFGLDAQERAAFFADADVKNFIGEVRSAIAQKRAISNVGLTIPDVMLGLLRENVQNYSKLYRHVNVRAVSGTARMNIMGSIPEAVWTEMCAKLNELDLTFNNVEVDGYKVGGYFAVCNAILEDSDIALASEIITAISQAIGIALDKAILYGTGTKMPLGIISRLAQTSAPSDYPATARTWVDLRTSNIKSIASTVTGLDLFKQILLDGAAAKGKYSRGEKVWVMNETTYTALQAEGLSVNSGGAIVTAFDGRIPVVGGIVEVLDFIPDNVIIGGYMDLYLLAERAGTQLDQSSEYRFLDDQTVFKGTARYDGIPVIAEAFVAIGINGVTPTATMTFAPDTANQGE